MNHLLLCVSGPSGIGKSTLLQKLESAGYGLEVRSKTTRGLRPNDRRIQISKKELFELKAAGKCLEIIEYDHELYCITLEDTLKVLETSVALIDVNEDGLKQILNANLPVKVVSVYITADAQTLFERQISRGVGSHDSRIWRLKESIIQIERAFTSDLYQYFIQNDDLSQSVTALIDIIQNKPVASNPSFDFVRFKTEMENLIDSIT